MKIKKILKITGIIFLTITLVFIGIGIYFYQTNPGIKAIVNNDESKLYYFPSKQMQPMDDLHYSESSLTVDDTIQIPTLSLKECKFYLNPNKSVCCIWLLLDFTLSVKCSILFGVNIVISGCSLFNCLFKSNIGLSASIFS